MVDSVPIRSILLNLCAGEPVRDAVLGADADFRVEAFCAAAPHTLGFLMAASGVGALAGAMSACDAAERGGLGVASLSRRRLFGAALIGFALSRRLWLSMLLLPFAGFGMMQQMAASNTILQTIVDDEKRGRVMAFYSMAFQGMAPFGSLLAGSMAARVGAPATVFTAGWLCMAGSLWFASRLPEFARLCGRFTCKWGLFRSLRWACSRPPP